MAVIPPLDHPTLPMSVPQNTSKSNSRNTRTDHELEQWRPLVWMVVNRVAAKMPPSVAPDDLFSAGFLGLMAAKQKYDPSQGASFKTYAYHRIRGAVLDELRRMDPLPRSQRESAKREGRQPPRFLGLPCDEDGQASIASEELGDSVEGDDTKAALRREMERLPEKMRIVMESYYQKGLKMREIASLMGLTESRVSQIHSNAIARLRRSMNPDG